MKKIYAKDIIFRFCNIHGIHEVNKIDDECKEVEMSLEDVISRMIVDIHSIQHYIGVCGHEKEMEDLS